MQATLEQVNSEKMQLSLAYTRALLRLDRQNRRGATAAEVVALDAELRQLAARLAAASLRSARPREIQQ
ncbi:MAG: hypothetical protein GX601_05640 [Anaerolineales bacterium]|nr:hypothetical protein [Anaerolineales bacterium]